MDLRLEQEDRFRLPVQLQEEDRRVIQSLLGPELEAFHKWLMAQTRDIEEAIDLVVLEHFISRLPRGSSATARCR